MSVLQFFSFVFLVSYYFILLPPEVAVRVEVLMEFPILFYTMSSKFAYRCTRFGEPCSFHLQCNPRRASCEDRKGSGTNWLAVRVSYQHWTRKNFVPIYCSNRIVAIPHMMGIFSYFIYWIWSTLYRWKTISKHLFDSFIYNSVVVFCMIGWSEHIGWWEYNRVYCKLGRPTA